MKRFLILTTLWLTGCGNEQEAPAPSAWSVEPSVNAAVVADSDTDSTSRDLAEVANSLIETAGTPAVEQGRTGSSSRISPVRDIAPCELPEPKRWEPGTVVKLVDAELYCDIIAVPVTVLKPSISGAHPDPGNLVLMTSTGKYVTRTASSVTIWNADGSVERTFGQRGEGPGEFSSRGALKIFLGARDSLYVLDDGRRWSVFHPNTFEFVRTFRHPETALWVASIHMTPGGILFTTDFSGQAAPSSFHMTDHEGRVTRAFGTPAPVSPGADSYRLSAYDGKGGFWVVPRNGDRTGLTLEYWTTEGERLVTFRREVPWLPSDGYPAADDPTEPRLPEYDHLHVDTAGLIWVGVVVRDARWRPVTGSEKRDMATELWDVRVEVIDPRSGTVVASMLYDGPSEELPPMAQWLRNSSRSYRVSTDELDLGSVEIFDIHLTRR